MRFAYYKDMQPTYRLGTTTLPTTLRMLVFRMKGMHWLWIVRLESSLPALSKIVTSYCNLNTSIRM